MFMRRKSRNIAILPSLLILVSLALILGLRKTVTLSINGEARSVTTYALKVGNLLHSQGISLAAQDSLTPSLNFWLKDGLTITLLRAIPVQIRADGETRSIFSAGRSPETLLTQAEVPVLPDDLILSNGQMVSISHTFPANLQSLSLQVIRSVRYSLTKDGKSVSLASTAPTLGEALYAAGYTLYAADRLVPPADTPLTKGLSVTLTHSEPVTIQTETGDVVIRTASKTVGEALVAAHLTPQGLDYSLPVPSEPIPATRKIRLIRVTEQVLVEQTPLPFETEYQPASNIDLDSQSILQGGEYGLTARRVRVRYEDGQEASRQVDSEWVARQPQNKIVGYGINVVMHTATVDGTTIQYWRSLSMYATSYHPSEVGDTTASGLPLQKGVAAVDISIVPFFTQMYVPGYGEVTAADIGGGVIGRWIDLGYSDDDYVPWHEWVTVYFLWPPPGNIVWVVP